MTECYLSECDGSIVVTCKCRRDDTTCSHGHHFHRCLEHNALIQTPGPFAHTVSTAVCTCEQGNVLRLQLTQNDPSIGGLDIPTPTPTVTCPHTELTVSGEASHAEDSALSAHQINVAITVRCVCGTPFVFVGVPLGVGMGAICRDGGAVLEAIAIPASELDG